MGQTTKIAVITGGMMLCFALLIAQQPPKTEDYLPILADGRMWVYGDSMAGHSNYPLIHDWIYKEIEKDTILDNRMCKKVSGWSTVFPERDYVQYYYEESGIVYKSYLDEYGKPCFSPDNTHIDMNLKVGDDFGLGKVIKVDSINVRGVIRKRITMNSCKPTEEEAFFVEGIGASSNSYVDPGPGSITETGYIRYLLSVIDENENVIFTQEDFRAPSYSQTGIERIEDDTKNDDRIYDLFGRLVANPIQGTVYIRNSKKFVQTRH